MDQLADAVDRVLLGESLRDIAASYRESLLVEVGLDPDEARSITFEAETTGFMGKLCRHLSERHAGDPRVESSLHEWVKQVRDYDAYDSLLSAFDRFDGRDAVVARGRKLFPGPLTAHWSEA